MIEHRLIERMIAILAQERTRLVGGGDRNPGRSGTPSTSCVPTPTVAIMARRRTSCSAELEGRPLSDELKGTMRRLKDEHQQARRMVRDLERCNLAMVRGDLSVRQEMMEVLRDIAKLYPKHIEAEDRHFFIPVMEHFSPAEQDIMLIKFYEFDQRPDP